MRSQVHLCLDSGMLQNLWPLSRKRTTLNVGGGNVDGEPDHLPSYSLRYPAKRENPLGAAVRPDWNDRHRT